MLFYFNVTKMDDRGTKLTELVFLISDFVKEHGWELRFYPSFTDDVVAYDLGFKEESDINDTEDYDLLRIDMSRDEKVVKMRDYIEKIDGYEKDLIIVDNYILPNRYDEHYKTMLLKILNGCKKITIITSDYNEELYSFVKEILDIDIEIKISKNFHDRFWLTDNKGIVVGTSLNGIGKKFCLIDKLKDADLKELKEIIKFEIN
ncbi:TPA: hypothetical protein SOL98_002804 [Clostridioides difficile]|uniref:Uncharacterized protein n=1 Tax=Clostridioides difficile TaxID=1496 RepID=A0AB74QFK9_CLODI|nr:hypothetical protein [Clostridioides difficile]AYD22740.1 hypothetical protein DA434_16300 [Clostridioides difficile]EGT3903845.1 hypothetical protein [Clostridioides difficile]EGT3942698.1 hypothetical protein [Clostridioides difficile]EGT4099275.1 hypothetical protein [Clostridioides difficile]EGT4248445.1 hypothetical protein [Clostridioides difficile]